MPMYATLITPHWITVDAAFHKSKLGTGCSICKTYIVAPPVTHPGDRWN